MASAIVDLLADQPELRAMGKRGKDWWHANATPSSVAAQYAEVYTELMSDASRTR
jgi:hypothetical protein